MQVSNGDEEHGCRRIPSRDAQVPPPAKARRVDRNGNPRLSKGDLKRKRKAQALSEAINHCDYYVDSKGKFQSSQFRSPSRFAILIQYMVTI